MTDEIKSMPAQRLGSLDAYRGLVMFLMAAEVCELSRVAGFFPDSWFWQFLGFHQSHVAWTGCSVHDLIQPSFSFMVGVALPFSIASRVKRGKSWVEMNLHAIWRAILLIFMGFFLRSMGHEQTNFTFEDTLTQIGLGYWFLFLLGFRSLRAQWATFGFLVFGYWLAFVLYPTPPAGFDYAAVGVSPEWEHLNTGFLAHWNKNTNLAAAFDRWFLNLFPRESVFVYNGGGYQTLSFIPTLATMILGLVAGQVLRRESAPRDKVRWLALGGAALLLGGLLLHGLGLCPIVKRIWTPAWTLFSGGLCFWILAGLYQIIDAWGYSKWAFPLLIFGMNAIALYWMHWTLNGFILDSFRIHLGQEIFLLLGEPFETLLGGIAILAVNWGVLFWMYRNKVFVRI